VRSPVRTQAVTHLDGTHRAAADETPQRTRRLLQPRASTTCHSGERNMEIELGEGRGRGAGVKGFRAIDRSARTSSRRREPRLPSGWRRRAIALFRNLAEV
jgi:hypothetical protein